MSIIRAYILRSPLCCFWWQSRVLDAFWAILCFNLTCSCNTWWLFITESLLKNWIYKQIRETSRWREMQSFLVFGEKPENWIEKLWGPLVKNDLNHKALGSELRMFWLKTQRLTKSALRTERVAVPVLKKPWQIFYISNTPKAFSSLPLLLSISSGIITLLYSTDKTDASYRWK